MKYLKILLTDFEYENIVYWGLWGIFTILNKLKIINLFEKIKIYCSGILGNSTKIVKQRSLEKMSILNIIKI